MKNELDRHDSVRRPGKFARWASVGLMVLAANVPGVLRTQAQEPLPSAPIEQLDCFPHDIYLPLIMANSEGVNSSQQESAVELGSSPIDISQVPVIDTTTIISNSTVPDESYDPSGLSRKLPNTDSRRFRVDSEVEEPPYNLINNAQIVDKEGNVVTEMSTLSFTEEPTGVDIGPDGHLYMSDDDKSMVYEVIYHSDTNTLELIREIPIARQHSDTEDIAMAQDGSMTLAGGDTDSILTSQAGPNGVIDGVCAPGGDDVTTTFDTSLLNIFDPEGVDVVQINGSTYYYIVGNDRRHINIAKVSEDGATVVLEEKLDISQVPSRNLSSVRRFENGDVGVTYRGRDNVDPVVLDGTYAVFRPNSQPGSNRDGDPGGSVPPPGTIPLQDRMKTSNRHFKFPSKTIFNGGRRKA